VADLASNLLHEIVLHHYIVPAAGHGYKQATIAIAG
jgi:hypothetical protein